MLMCNYFVFLLISSFINSTWYLFRGQNIKILRSAFGCGYINSNVDGLHFVCELFLVSNIGQNVPNQGFFYLFVFLQQKRIVLVEA